MARVSWYASHGLAWTGVDWCGMGWCDTGLRGMAGVVWSDAVTLVKLIWSG